MHLKQDPCFSLFVISYYKKVYLRDFNTDMRTVLQSVALHHISLTPSHDMKEPFIKYYIVKKSAQFYESCIEPPSCTPEPPQEIQRILFNCGIDGVFFFLFLFQVE